MGDLQQPVNLTSQLLRYRATISSVLKRSPLMAVGGVTVIVMIFSVFTSLILVRGIPKEEYGQLVYFYAGMGLIRLMMNLGLGLNLSRDISANSDPDHVREVIYSTLVARFVSILLMVAVIITVAMVAPQPFLGHMALAAAVASVADLTHAVISGMRNTTYVGLMTAVQPISYGVLAALLILFGAASGELLMDTYTFTFVLMTVLGIYLIWRTKALGMPRTGDVRWSYLRSVLMFIIPIYLANLATQGTTTVSTGIFGWLGKYQESAEFGVLYNLVSISISIGGPALIGGFYPYVSHLYSSNKIEAAVGQIQEAVALLASVYVWIAVALFAFAEVIVITLFTVSYAPVAPLLRIMAPQLVLLGSLPVFTYALTAIGKPWRAIAGLLAQLVALVVLLVASGSGLDVTTMTWASLVSAAVGVLVQWYMLQSAFTGSVFKASVLPFDLVKILGLGAVLAAGVTWVSHSFGTTLTIGHIILGVAFTVVYWVLLVIPKFQRWQRESKEVKVIATVE